MRALAAVLFIFAAGCAEPPPPEGYGEGLGTPENPIPEDDLSYVVTSSLDFTTNGALPQPVVDTVAGLRAFSSNPARALLAKADQTAVQTLKSQIGTTLTNSLEGWLNTEIDKARIATKTLRQYATELTTISETTLTKFYLDSVLSMTPAKTTHMLGNLNFRHSRDIVVLLGGTASDVLKQTPTLAVMPGGAMTLGDHKFSMAFGNHAWSGINLASTAIYNRDVSSTFVGGILCAEIARAVSLKCSGTSCVGHESQLKTICDGGVTGFVDDLRTHVAAFKLEMLRFAAGNARLVDDHGDGLADRILDGTWQVEMNMSGTMRQVSATFIASK